MGLELLLFSVFDILSDFQNNSVIEHSLLFFHF